MEQSEVIWEQESWLTDTNIVGFVDIDILELINIMDGAHNFKLGLSSCTRCAYLDGNGNNKGCWWNAVGPMTPYHGGMPGFNQQIAKSQSLYIWSKRSNNCGTMHTSDGKWYDTPCSERKHFV